jgi:hypothetical protein
MSDLPVTQTQLVDLIGRAGPVIKVYHSERPITYVYFETIVLAVQSDTRDCGLSVAARPPSSDSQVVKLYGQAGLNALFPKVHTWVIGDFLHLYHRSWLALNDTNGEYSRTFCNSVARLIPQSVTSLSISSSNRLANGEYNILMADYLKALSRHEDTMMRRLDLPNFCMTNELVKLPQLQQLTCLFAQWTEESLSMADLPRTLTWFGVNNGLERRKFRTITLIDAPPQLTNITIDNSSLFVINEPLPRQLKALEFTHASDPFFVLSATTLPPSLTLLNGRNVLIGVDYGKSESIDWENASFIDLGKHLFQKVDGSPDINWSSHWPPGLRVPVPIDDRWALQNDMLEQLRDMNHEPQCAYTLTKSNRPTTSTGEANQLLLDESLPRDDPYSLSSAMSSMTDGMIDTYMTDIINQFTPMDDVLPQLPQSDVNLCSLWMDRHDYRLPISENYFAKLCGLLRVENAIGLPFNPYIVAVCVYTGVESSKYQKKQQFLLDHINKMLPNITKLQCYNHSKLYHLPKWVKSLIYTHSTGGPEDGSSLGPSVELNADLPNNNALRTDDAQEELAIIASKDIFTDGMLQSLLLGFDSDVSLKLADQLGIRLNSNSRNGKSNSMPLPLIDEMTFGGTNHIQPILRHLPPGLTSLELVVTEPFMTQLATEFSSFVANLPRSLLYFSVYSHHEACTSRKLDLSGVVAVLPPNLRRLYFPTYQLKRGFSDLYSLCQDVCEVPSLRLLVVTFQFETSSEGEFEVASHHCLAVTKKAAYLQWCVEESLVNL